MGTIIFENGTDGLFDLLTFAFELQTQADNNADNRRTSFDAMVTAIANEFTAAGYVQAFASAETGMSNEESRVSEMTSVLKTVCEQIMIEKVDAAVSLPNKNLLSALLELQSQMGEESESLKRPTVTVTVTPDGGNTGDGVLLATRITTDGLINPQILAETIDVAANLESGTALVALKATSSAVSDSLSPDGLGGSGLASATMRTYTVLTGITGSGSRYAFTTSASTLPGNWIANVGTLGTDIKSGQPQTDTVTVTGSPAAGTIRITCTTTNLGTQSTVSLPFNATAAQIQAAIADMTGFSRVSVSSTGTTPNFTHTINYYGMREAVTLAVVNSTDVGTFTPATPTAYATPSIGGSPLVLISDGATLVSVSHRMTHLQPRTAYSVNAWLALNAASASGVVEISLTNGIGGSIIQDDAGNNLSYTVNATSLTTAYQAAAKLTSSVPFFMTPTVLPASVYLRIRASTTLVSTRQLFVENPIVAPSIRFYTGGPFFAAYAGPNGFADGDLWEVACANDYGGTMSWMMERNFAMRSKGINLPHTALGTIAELTPYVATP